MKKISIEHLARVEGSGGVTATIDGNVVTDVKFYVNEGPRLVEKLVLGKTPEEDVNLVPRICAICSISHRYAAIRAMEKALEVKVPPQVTLLRELMHLGEMVESHSLHVYYLALPDYLGFPNVVAMASQYGVEAKIALEMKQFGNHIMKTVSGRFIHGENPVIGGFGKFPSREELLFIKNRAIQFMPFVLKTAKLFLELNYPDIPEEETIFACLNPKGNKYGFVGDEILLSTGEKIDVEDYKSLTNEFVVPHSYCKRSRYKGKPYSVGALARVNNLGERLKGAAGKMFRKYYNGRWKKNPLLNNAAQALEIIYSFERIPEVVKKLLQYPDCAISPCKIKNGKGTGAVEAPRGTLFHSYEIAGGRIVDADIITPTAQNAEDIERYCYLASQNLLQAGQETKIGERIEWVIRSYDPCISCSVHMVQVKTAAEDDWKEKLNDLKKDGSPVFVGIGSLDHSDDGVGLALARELRRQGVRDVWLQSELEGRENLMAGFSPDRPLIFLDALDFGQKPGRITLLPLEHVFWNSTLSHRLAAFASCLISPEHLKNAFLLGVQPEIIEEGKQMSFSVRKAIFNILEGIKN